MTYTADFSTIRKPGEMFQSINGDVWMVIATYGCPRIASEVKLQRQTVERIWTAKRQHPNVPSNTGVWKRK